MRTFFTDEKSFNDWPVVGALSTLILLARNSHINSLPFFKDPRFVNFEIGMYPSPLWLNSVKALNELLERPYWSRVWIVQEMILTRHALVHYDRHVIPIEAMFQGRNLV